MRRWLPGLLVLAAIGGLALADVRLASGWLGGRDFRLAVYLVASAVVSIDLLDLVLRSYLRHVNTLPLAQWRVAPLAATASGLVPAAMKQATRALAVDRRRPPASGLGPIGA